MHVCPAPISVVTNGWKFSPFHRKSIWEWYDCLTTCNKAGESPRHRHMLSIRMNLLVFKLKISPTKGNICRHWGSNPVHVKRSCDIWEPAQHFLSLNNWQWENGTVQRRLVLIYYRKIHNMSQVLNSPSLFCEKLVNLFVNYGRLPLSRKLLLFVAS